MEDISPQRLGIPSLALPGLEELTMPKYWEKWGRIGRRNVLGEDWGYHFYTADVKFEGCWRYPDLLLGSGVVNVVEPNFSTSKGQPQVVTLFDIYRKRSLSTYWQSKGVRIWVDLNVEPSVHHLNQLGVPTGYPYFATRYQRKLPDGSLQGLDGVKRDLDKAREISGADKVQLIVYGGGVKVREFCLDHMLQWVPDSNDWGKGRKLTDNSKEKNNG